ncbi:MAG TPA: glycosyltransferase family 4 protein [Longimicrobiales bacterium]|nr:glycosyltransferase family 4 protein [Longimicrobiales bacterium]
MPREPAAGDRDHGRVAVASAVPRILAVAESLPHPTLKGGDHRTWQNINALAAFGRVGVFGLCSNDRRRDSVPDLHLEFWTTSVDPALSMPPPHGVKLQGRAWLLDSAGHPSDLYYSELAAGELSRLAANFRPDVVIVEGLWLHRYLDVLRTPGCRVILDCHNVEAQMSRELASTLRGADLESRVRRDVLPARTEAIERRAVGAADEVWVCSAEDKRLMRELYSPSAAVRVVPNGIRLTDYDPIHVARDGRSEENELTLVFPGFFGHAPNVNAARFLISEIFPRLVQASAASRLLLVGALPPPELRAAAQHDDRITVTGAVPDMKPWLAQATAVAVPLFQGSGTRLKIIEALAAGVPVISTAKGAEGLGVRDKVHLLIAETADEFVRAALTVWRDAGLRGRLVAGGRALVAEQFSWGAIGGRIRHAIMGEPS